MAKYLTCRLEGVGQAGPHNPKRLCLAPTVDGEFCAPHVEEVARREAKAKAALMAPIQPLNPEPKFTAADAAKALIERGFFWGGR